MSKNIGSYEFYSKENMKLIIDIFNDYMRERHNIQIEAIDDMKSVKKMVYSTMNDVYAKHQGKPPQDLNVLVLSIIREHYLQKAKQVAMEPKKPIGASGISLNRDAELFGKRQVQINSLIPEGNPYSKRESDITPVALDKLITERDREFNPTANRPDISQLGKQIRETAEDTSSFMKRLDMLQSERHTGLMTADVPSTSDKLNADAVMDRLIVDSATQNMNKIENLDPKQLFTNPISTELLGSGHSKPFNPSEATPQQTITTPMESGEAFLNPRNYKTKEIDKYLSINSADRNWDLEPTRYRYSVNSLGDNNDLQRRYRNIECISVGKVVIPEEIIERATVTNQNLKTFFNYDFSFAYPYLILKIDEFDNVYDGTNDNVRKAFSKLIYHRSYKAPNGRGYIILKPMQKEKKRFYPTPLSSIGKLSITLQKPNGDVLNTSADSYKLFKVEYEQFNTQYLKIVTDVYFDKNEFFVGDEVILQGHNMTVLNGNMSDIAVKKFNEFINRPEGHEVKQVGGANDSGYYRSFYIQAPGSFDRVNGQYALDSTLINNLNEYNGQIDFCDPNTPTNGRILNNSLQHTISLKLETLVDDARIIERKIL
jgi:hypothetical protein